MTITLKVTPDGYEVSSESGLLERTEDLVEAAATAQYEARSTGALIQLVPGCEGTFRLGTPDNKTMEIHHWQINFVNGEVHIWQKQNQQQPVEL